jgi:hypothetical protein
MGQRVHYLNLRYVHRDSEESHPHFLVAVRYENRPWAQEINVLDFHGLQENNVAYYFATYADLRSIYL